MKARQCDAIADYQRADAARAAELMRRKHQGVGAERRKIDIEATGRLHGIHVHHSAEPPRRRGNLGDRLDYAGLVIGHHQAREHAPRASRARASVAVAASTSTTPSSRTGSAATLARRGPRRLQHGVVLDRRDADRVPTGSHHPVVGLRARRW